MKRALILLLLMLPLLISSCGRDYPTIVDLYIDFWLRDSNLKNLLNTETPSFYKKEDIRVFYIEDGIKKEFYNPSLDAPRHFLIDKNEGNGEFAFRLFVYEGKSKETEITTTLVEWRTGLVDTVKSEITRFNNSTIATKIWYNSVLKYDNDTAQSFAWGNAIVRKFIEIKK